MRGTWRVAVLLLGALACAPKAKAPDDVDARSIERTALVTVFMTTERPSRLMIFRGRPADSPILGESAAADSFGLAHRPDSLGIPVPAIAVTQPEIDAHFAANPDAWEAWFARYPGSGGIVEVTAPRFAGNVEARVLVGRICGEHCRMGWDVTLRKDDEGDWSVSAIKALALPRP